MFLFSSRNDLGAQAEIACTGTQNTTVATNTSFTLKCGRAPRVILKKKTTKKQGLENKCLGGILEQPRACGWWTSQKASHNNVCLHHPFIS